MDDLNQFTGADHSKDDKPVMASVLSVLLALMSPLCCCCCAGRIFLVLSASITLGLIAIVKDWRGKAMAVLGVAFSSVILLVILGANMALKNEIRDINKLTANPQKYISQYEETGQVPVEFTRYKSQKYAKLWLAMGFDGFGEFYKALIKQMKMSYSISVGELEEPEETPQDTTQGTEPTELSVAIKT